MSHLHTIHPTAAKSGVGAKLLRSVVAAALAVVFASTVSTQAQDRQKLNRLIQSSSSSSSTANDPAMKAFTEGRDLITEEKWGKAASLFNSFIAQFPGDKNADAAYYWLAYAYQKQNRLQDADRTLARLVNAFPRSSWADDAKKLRVIVAGQMGRPTDVDDDNPDVEIKIIALQSLCQADRQRCATIVSDVLRQGTRAPLRLREAAITLLGRFGGSEAVPALLNIVRNDPDEKLRIKAVSALRNTEDESVLEPLKELAMRADFVDNGITDTAIHALSEHESPRAVNVLAEVALNGKNLEARKHAIYMIARRKGEPAVDELFRIYDADQNLEIRKQVLAGLGNRISPRALTRLVEIARSAPQVELRKQAIRAIPNRNSEEDLNVLLPLYEAERDEELKDYLLEAIARYRNPNAYQKLMDVVRSTTAPVERRKRAITWLSHSKDPAVLKFLEDILK